ncbi:MAG: arylsulfatase [Chloroflexi bacterium]|nr:arylsulfatase [Chloroflexota bacterium]
MNIRGKSMVFLATALLMTLLLIPACDGDESTPSPFVTPTPGDNKSTPTPFVTPTPVGNKSTPTPLLTPTSGGHDPTDSDIVLSQPNVVLIVADDLGWNDVGYHGGAEFETPNIDRLVQEGVEFDRFYATPICTPTRAALLTGRDALRFGTAYSTIMPWDNFGLPPQEHLMPESFQQAGYQTAMIGKWHLGHTIRAHHPNERGFDYFWGHLNTTVSYFTHEVLAGGYDMQLNGESVYAEGEYATYLANEQTVNWLQNRDKTRPFFLYVPYLAPHSPLEAPEELLSKYSYIEDENRRTYVAMVDALDQGVGQILDTLDTEGIADNTIVLFFSDNGGTQYFSGDNTPLRGYKMDAFEGATRVAAGLRWPDRIEGGTKLSQVISVMDMFPTLTAMAGIEPQNDKPFDGMNVQRSIENGEVFERDDYLFFIADEPTPGTTRVSVMHQDWKLVQIIDHLQTTATVENYLFNLKEDPTEQTNLADEHPEMVDDFAARIKEWRSQHPIAGVHTHVVPHPGWRAPYDYAEAMAAYDGLIDEETEVHFMGNHDLLEFVDMTYGEKGKATYK